MNETNRLPLEPPKLPNPSGPDLDDLIFREEGWQISDR